MDSNLIFRRSLISAGSLLSAGSRDLDFHYPPGRLLEDLRYYAYLEFTVLNFLIKLSTYHMQCASACINFLTIKLIRMKYSLSAAIVVKKDIELNSKLKLRRSFSLN